MSYKYVQYELTCGNGTYANESLNASLFQELISELELYDFIVLEPSVPLEGSLYLQATTLEEATARRPQIIVEIRVQQKQDLHPFRHYRLMTEHNERVLRLFLEYWGEQRLPDVELDGWQEVTDEF
ncbi:hypothetical protein [Paenibacillus campi]|uniref:hypothetical protein n=1 Tax=Paenibacillus campi TaxID=3106031 RepID=UPI002AFFD544|nr:MULTISPECIES: hypothetical protein [unclassified Paenibacillus]